MELFAQATNPTDAASWLQLFDRFGVSLVMLGLFIAATAYILHRLLNAKTGILTGYASDASQAHKQLAATVERMEQSDSQVADTLQQMQQLLLALKESAGHLETVHFDPHSRVATIGLTRTARHACDVVEQMAKKLGIIDDVAPQLLAMREELDQHLEIDQQRRAQQ